MKKILLTVFGAAQMMFLFSQPCTDLFFSEYIEGTSNNKAIEIYNPTLSAINLTGYVVYRSNNGSPSYQDSLVLSGTLPAGGVYIAGNPSAVVGITSLSDTLHTITFYNGDDVLHLVHNGVLLDVIGELGVDPGTNWPVGTGATSEFTLVRMVGIQQGTTSWTAGATQWDVFPQDNLANLGSHTMTSCGAASDTLVNFTQPSGTFNEGAIANIPIYLNTPVNASLDVDVVLVGGTGSAADVNNYTTQTVNFPNNVTTASLNVTITDDITQEGAETIIFALRNPSGALDLGPDTLYTLTINASDQPWNPGLPFYSIAQVRGANTQGQPDSMTVLCGVGGTVYGVNFRTTGFSFFINDATAGMNIFSPTNTFGYTVTEGDSVVVYGEVTTFRGLSQMAFLDSVLLISTGNPIPNPLVVTTLNESTEGEMIRINGLTLVTPSQWTNNTNGFTVDATDGITTFQVRIERNTTAIPMPAPAVPFDVIGIGSQFASTTTPPFTDGYQIVPRKIEDIILLNAVENENGWDVSIYPNPTSGILNISSEIDNYSIQIMDLTGKVVINKNQLSANAHIDMMHLANGIYMVKLNKGSEQLTKKIILKK